MGAGWMCVTLARNSRASWSGCCFVCRLPLLHSDRSKLLDEFDHLNRLSALVAQEDIDHIKLRDFFPELAMRTHDAQHIARPVGLGFKRPGFRLLEFWGVDRLAAVVAQFTGHVRRYFVIRSAMSAMDHPGASGLL